MCARVARRLRGVTIEVDAAELYALAAGLRSTGEGVAGVPARLGEETVPGELGPVLAVFCAEVSAAARLLAGELDWLGTTIAGVADSWTGLDSGLLAPRGRATPR